MSSDVAIRIEGLGKAYRITHQEQQITLAEQALQRLRHPLQRAPVETFWALSGIDLEIKRGEVLGLIGRNGAGKSTLLKILSRITPPTNGRVDVYGRVGSLLEVGTGFHPELTGRENIYLNGSILGMRNSEIQRHFDAIVEFAGVERFLDTPVKRYSSGMYVRLAFAVAAHLDSEILLVDEVLAVGDQEFQDKCLGKMRDVTSAGRTVILVSHTLSSIRWLAERCVLLEQGGIAASGDAGTVIDQYRGLTLSPEGWTRRPSLGQGDARECELIRASLVDSPSLTCGAPISIDLDAEINSDDATQLCVGVVFRSLGKPIGATVEVVGLEFTGRQRCVTRVTVSSRELAPGHYTVSVYVGALADRQPPFADDVVEDALAVDLVADSSSSWLLQNWQSTFHGSLCLQSESSLLSHTRPTRGGLPREVGDRTRANDT